MRARDRAPQDPFTVRLDISFQPIGAPSIRRVATAWLEKGFVRWSSPCLDESHERADVPAFEHQFGDSACTLPAFMRAMQWLDAVCFGAADLEVVRRACLLNPEYGLVCMPADGGANTPATGEQA
jgi:hypothetical protein